MTDTSAITLHAAAVSTLGKVGEPSFSIAHIPLKRQTFLSPGPANPIRTLTRPGGICMHGEAFRLAYTSASRAASPGMIPLRCEAGRRFTVTANKSRHKPDKDGKIAFWKIPLESKS